MTSAGRVSPYLSVPNQASQLPRQAAPSSPIVAGVILLQAYLIIIFSRVVDVTFLSGLKIPIITLVLMVGCAFASGTLLRVATNRIGLLMIVFSGWACIAAAFGTWKTGSIDSIEVIAMSLLIGACIIALVTTPRAALRCMYTVGAASVIGGLLGMVKGEMHEGRLALAAGSFGDPNEYSSMLLMGLPCVLLYASRAKGFVRKGIAYASAIPLGLSFLRTGSRGGMIALIVYVLVIFITSSFSQKVVLAGVVFVATICAIAILPDYLETRFRTTFTGDVTVVDEETARRLGADLGSTEGRWRLLIGSIEVTARHPLLGVGPGNFPGAFFTQEQERGRRVGWNVNHNSYTQVSSETGIPGFLMFTGMLLLSVKALRRIKKAAPPGEAATELNELKDAARCLQRVLLIICTASFFLSMAYNPIFFVAIALAISFDVIAQQQVAAAQKPFAPPVRQGLFPPGYSMTVRP